MCWIAIDCWLPGLSLAQPSSQGTIVVEGEFAADAPTPLEGGPEAPDPMVAAARDLEQEPIAPVPSSFEPAATAESGSRTTRLEAPPAPDQREPFLAGEVNMALVFALGMPGLCPDGAGCVFESGGGVGGLIERRWPTGLAAGLAYEAWFLDSSGVYELGVLHTLRVSVRHLLLPAARLHPFFGGGIGALLLGDRLRIASVGAAIEGSVGLEVEVTESIALTLRLPIRLFMMSGFVTPRDRVERATSPAINTAAAAILGLVILETP